MKMGIGVTEFSYYQTDQKLVNLVDPKTSAFPARKPGFTYSRDGWPISIPAGTFPDNWMGWVIAATDNYVAPGKYQVWAGGSGKFYFGHPDLAASGQQNTWEVTGPIGGPQRKIAEFTIHHADAGRTLCCLFSVDPKNPLNHIMVIPAGESTASVFTKQYINELKQFKCLRTGGFTGVVNSPEVDWTTGAPNPFGYPAKWLTAIRLANETGCDLWLNIPHKASDQFVTTLAGLVRVSLNSGITVYLEYSDEIWNNGWPFGPATKWVTDWTHSNIGPTAPYQFGHVERAHHVQELFCQTAPYVKVARIFACQHYNPFLFWQAGTYMKKKGYKFDAVATAPYTGTDVGPDWAKIDHLLAAGDKSGAMSILFDDAVASFADLDKFAQEYRKTADDLGIPDMFAYECGPGIQISPKWAQTRLDLYYAWHSDPRMHDFLANTYFPWMAKYYKLAMYTSHTKKSPKGEAWGVKETAGQTPHPKLDACLEWCAAHNH